MKKVKTNKVSHASNSKYGMGDFYGSAIKNPVGRVREDFMTGPTKQVKKAKPPKSLA